MIYRDIGNTGLKAGVIGLGCEHLDGVPYEQVKETIDAALENRVNLLDVFMPGDEVRGHIAKALGSRRQNVLIQGHIGSTDTKQQYDISRDLPTVERYFEKLLRLFGYIDFGMLFYIDTEDDFNAVFNTGFITYAEKLKKQGDVRHIGFSSHNPVIAAKAIETGIPELMMFSINPAFDLLPANQPALDHMASGFGAELFRGLDPARQALYALCEKKGVAVTVMKALGGGRLISPEFTPFETPLTVPQCIHYALTRPAVVSVLPGFKTRGEVETGMRYFELDDSARDYSAILGTLRNDFKGNCVYCGHCAPCPVEIDIATVHKYLDIAKLDLENIPPSIRSHYLHLEHAGRDCIACGSCEERCPFGVPIIENMAEAARIFQRPDSTE